MSDDDPDSDGGDGDGVALTDLPPPEQERRLQAKLDDGTITETEYARLTALRFGRDPGGMSFEDAADFFGLTPAELREEMAWLSESSLDD